jgi:hypothetical protein
MRFKHIHIGILSLRRKKRNRMEGTHPILINDCFFPFPSTCSHPEAHSHASFTHSLPIADRQTDTHKEKRHASGRSIAFMIAYLRPNNK